MPDFRLRFPWSPVLALVGAGCQLGRSFSSLIFWSTSSVLLFHRRYTFYSHNKPDVGIVFPFYRWWNWVFWKWSDFLSPSFLSSHPPSFPFPSLPPFLPSPSLPPSFLPSPPLFLHPFNFSWSIAAAQYCVLCYCTAQWVSCSIHISPLFWISFSLGHRRTSSRVPRATQWVLISYLYLIISLLFLVTLSLLRICFECLLVPPTSLPLNMLLSSKTPTWAT